MKLGIGVSSIGRFLPYIAQANGLFERENLTVEIVNQRDEERAVPDIVSGATPIGTPNAPSLIFSLLEGSDIVIIAGLLNRPAFFLAADPAITRISDLKGKRVAINEPKRMAGMVMLALLRKWGLEIGVDLHVVQTTEAMKRCWRKKSTRPCCRPRKLSWPRRRDFASSPIVSSWTATGCRLRPPGVFSRNTG